MRRSRRVVVFPPKGRHRNSFFNKELRYNVLLDVGDFRADINFEPNCLNVRAVVLDALGLSPTINRAVLEALPNSFISSLRDPRKNKRFNALKTPAINPTRNRSLNIKSNPSLRTNPHTQRTLDPRSNPDVNFRQNKKLSPSFNRSLRPSPGRRDQMVLWSLDLTPEGLVVPANDQVFVMFDDRLRHSGTVVLNTNRRGGAAVFDLNQRWIATWSTDRRGGFLRWSLKNDWVGWVV